MKMHVAPMRKVYLAGPISGLSYGECTDWREGIKLDLSAVGIQAASPLRGKDYLSNETVIADQYLQAMSTQAAITGRDRWDVQSADLVLANLLGAERVSIGTVMEMAWADAYRVPVCLVMEPEGNLHDHAMFREVATWWVTDLPSACDVIKATLGA